MNAARGMHQEPVDEHVLEVAALRGEIDRLRRDLHGAVERETALRQAVTRDTVSVDHATVVLTAMAGLADAWWDRYSGDPAGAECIRELRATVHRLRAEVGR